MQQLGCLAVGERDVLEAEGAASDHGRADEVDIERAGRKGKEAVCLCTKPMGRSDLAAFAAADHAPIQFRHGLSSVARIASLAGESLVRFATGCNTLCCMEKQKAARRRPLFRMCEVQPWRALNRRCVLLIT